MRLTSNANGVTDASTSAPDQSGDDLAPGGSVMGDEEDSESPSDQMGEDENAEPLHYEN